MRYYGEFQPYVPVAQRRLEALKKIMALKKSGQEVHPIESFRSRQIAKSFWGQAWCRHLEAFSDYENRLPRGRTYVRNGSVLHLGIQTGEIEAMVSGSNLYDILIRIDPLQPKKWAAIKKRCQGKIGSLIELLQGRISSEIMEIVTDPEEGLFPKPREIHLDCNCPDWADLCKHLAAVLYGVGVRLDHEPELLFKLRGVDHQELIAVDAEVDAIAGGKTSRRRTLKGKALNDVFGVELDDVDEEEAPKPRNSRKKASPAGKKKSPAKKGKRAAKKAAVSRKRATTKAKPAFRATSGSVRSLRKKLGLTQAEFAREAKVSLQSIRNWEEKTGKLNLAESSLEKLKALHARTTG